MWLKLKSIAHVLLAGAIGYMIVAVALFFLQRQFIFFPSSRVTTTPDDYGMSYESVSIPLESQENIHGWWVPNQQKNSPTLLYLHGNGGNVSTYLPWVERFRSVGFSVFLFDYRGYGLSQGRFPNEERLYEDAEGALNYLKEQQEVPPEKIYVFGQSLGSAVAIELATREPNLGGLALEGAFTSIRDVGQSKVCYAWLPLDLLLTQRFNSLEKISKLELPILFVHGTADGLIPYEMSEQLYQAAEGSTELWLVEGAGHDNVANVAGSEYEKRIWEFLVADT